MPRHSYYVYILTNKSNKVLYTGITNNLLRRMEEHRQKQIKGFSSKYNTTKLVYFEETNNVESALEYEKKIKGWLRKKKIDLINQHNPNWNDLYEILR